VGNWSICAIFHFEITKYKTISKKNIIIKLSLKVESHIAESILVQLVDTLVFEILEFKLSPLRYNYIKLSK